MLRDIMDISAAMFHALNRHAWFFDVYNFCLSAENLKKNQNFLASAMRISLFRQTILLTRRKNWRKERGKVKCQTIWIFSIVHHILNTRSYGNKNKPLCGILRGAAVRETRRNPTTFHNFLVTQNNFAIPVLEHLQRNFANQRLMAFTNLKPM